ncbi:hypothetical protein AX14_008465 [Amanita brunnescens Koide BX004]|nr:hypothetical protein AX14_008465 [Amanita brunnescens Koide BX004]
MHLMHLAAQFQTLFIALLTEQRFKSSAYTAGLLQQSGDVLKSLLMHARLPKSAEKAACDALHQVYVHEIKDLVKPSSGWNFSAQCVGKAAAQDAVLSE